MRVTAILLAAGKGSRFKSSLPKPLVRLGKSRIIGYSLKLFELHPGVSEIILVVNSGNIKRVAALAKKMGCKKVKSLVLGGERRQDSVFNALNKVSPQSQMVLIHDSARPFVKPREISALIIRAVKAGAAILGVPVKATIKQIACDASSAASRPVVKRTLDRADLWEIQTPQVFRKDLLLEAYLKFKDVDVTDDSAMVEKLNRRVELIRGSYDNIKITTPEDLIIAEAILKARSCGKAGGYVSSACRRI